MKSKKAKNECTFSDFLFVLGKLFISLCVLVIVINYLKQRFVIHETLFTRVETNEYLSGLLV